MHQIIRDSLLLVIAILSFLLIKPAFTDVILMDGQGMPRIVENDDFDKDFILMPGMSAMMFNDDLVL